MNVIATALPGVIILEPKIFKDNRGFFLESYQKKRYQEAGIELEFVQDNHSASQKGTLRGLHCQWRKPQGKLVRVIQGEIVDIAVDARISSPTCGQWVSVSLSSDNFKQIYVPPGFLHGFCVVSESAEVEYKCTALYDPEGEVSVRWDDSQLKIVWPISNPVLSSKDAKGLSFKEALLQLNGQRSPS